MKNILLIGGTGIIGKATVFEAIKQGYNVTTISKDSNSSLPKEVNQIIVDRKDSDKFKDVVSKLDVNWDVVFDIYCYDESDGKQVYELFKNNAKHIFVLSTVLVYDRSKRDTEPIKPNSKLTNKDELGGYVNLKLNLENFWNKINDVNYTILRPYHILGAGSFLGCIPDHNRDPKLLESIKNNKELNLCEAGEVEFNYVHPRDLAKVVLKAASNNKTFGKAYNVVNPEIIKAKDYFEIIGEFLNKKPIIVNKPIKKVWEEKNGWEMTTFPHIYDITELEKDIGFVPNTPLRDAIKETIDNYPEFEGDIKDIPVHKKMTLLPRPIAPEWLIDK